MCLSPHLSILLGGFSIEFLEKSIDHKNMYIKHSLCLAYVYAKKNSCLFGTMNYHWKSCLQSNFYSIEEPQGSIETYLEGEDEHRFLREEKALQSKLLQSRPLYDCRVFSIGMSKVFKFTHPSFLRFIDLQNKEIFWFIYYLHRLIHLLFDMEKFFRGCLPFVLLL